MNNDIYKQLITKTEKGINFKVKVVPNSSVCEITDIIDDSFKIKLDVPPVDGKANEKLVKFLSKIFKVPKSKISIISGLKSKNKLIEVISNIECIEAGLFNKIKS